MSQKRFAQYQFWCNDGTHELDHGMTGAEPEWPLVSVLIPTLNAEGMLGNCLGAIRAQTYPQDRVEIVVADGGSTDGTLDIAKRHGCIIVSNPRRVAEQGKRVALSRSTGEYILFVDADNEISTPDFLSLAVKALQEHPTAIGVESYYPASAKMSSFCKYLTATLHIGDPLSWIMSVEPVCLERKGAIERWTFPENSLAYPLGANGFVYHRATLELARAAEDFEDAHVALRVAQSGRREWLRLSGRGVYHYVVSGLRDFIRKRRRQTFHFLSLRHKKQDSWTQMQPRVRPLVACVYCASVIGPLYHAVCGFVRTGDWRWFWHPVASLASIVGFTWGVLTYWLTGRNYEAEAKLQPRQELLQK